MTPDEKQPTLADVRSDLLTIVRKSEILKRSLNHVHYILDKNIHGSEGDVEPTKPAEKESEVRTPNLRFDMSSAAKEALSLLDKCNEMTEKLKWKFRTEQPSEAKSRD